MARPESSRFCWPLFMTVVVWGFNFIALKLLYREMTPAAAALGRHVLMYPLLVIVCVAAGFSLRLPRRETIRISLFGMLSMGGYMILFMEALARTSAPEGAILIATAPLFTAVFAALAKQEPFVPRVVLGALVAFAGVGLVVFGGSELRMDHLVGNGLMIASAAAWATGAVISRPLVQQRHSLVVLTQSMPAALLVLLPYALADTLATPWLSLNVTTLLSFAHFTLLAGVLGFAGFFYGVQKVGAPGAMMYQYGVAPLATLFAWLFLGDALHPLQFLGMGIVLGGVVYASAARFREVEREDGPLMECPAEG